MERTTFMAIVLALALGIAACGGADAAAGPAGDPAGEPRPDPNGGTAGEPRTGSTTSASQTTSPSAPASTSTPTTGIGTSEDVGRAVERAFHDQWDAFVEITGDPDIRHPLVDEHFTGRAKQAVLDGVSRLLADGEAFRLPDDPDDFQPRIVDLEIVSETSAVVFECTVEGLVLFDRATGEVVDDSVGAYETRNRFERIDGRWLVSATTELRKGDPGCDEL